MSTLGNNLAKRRQSQRVSMDVLKGLFADKNKLYPLALLAVVALLVTILLTTKSTLTSRDYKVGDIVPETMKADADYSIVDEDSTARLREEAVRSEPPIFDYDSHVYTEIRKKVSHFFSKIGSFQQVPGGSEGDDLEELNSFLQSEISPELVQSFSKIKDRTLLQSEMLNVLDELLRNRYVIATKENLPSEAETGIKIRDLYSENQTSTYLLDLGGFADIQEVRRRVPERLQTRLKSSGLSVNISHYVELGTELAQQFLKPNLFYNSKATEEKKREVADQVKPVVISLEKGETVVRDGDRINTRQLMLLKGINKAKKSENPLSAFFGKFLLMLLLILTIVSFAQTFFKQFKPTIRDYYLMGTLLVFCVALAKGMLFLIEKTAPGLPQVPPEYFYYMIPVAAGAMAIQLVLRPESVVVFTLIFAVVIAILFDSNFLMGTFTLLSSLFGSYVVSKCQTRTSLFKASLSTALFSALIVVLFSLLISYGTSVHRIFVSLLITGSSSVWIFCVLSIAMPIIEKFDYVTDMRLIELANFNNPLLNRLALEAPGTYHHSRVVAQLVEAGAEQIGANPLLAMVSALYHDIGKTKAPQYFVENQTAETRNVHDKLKPSMSKMIIVSHIKDGIEMGKKAGLPSAVINGIPEHHGTSLITFFYHKAKDQEDPELDQIDESEFRYPGPKPRSKETALLLLADSVEAATKSLQDPTPEKIRGVVQKIFNKYFADGQLSECDLTLQDLHLIAKSFHRTLTSVYKPRVEYPEVTTGSGGTQKVKKQDASRNQQQPKGTQNKQKESEDDNGEDLKRLGL